MTVGIAAADANSWVDGLGSLYQKLHTGDPGAAGTANASAETTRKAMTRSASSGGVSTQTGSTQWATWTAGAETISHVTYWTDPSAGTFKGSFQLSASKPMTNGDTLTLSGCQVSVSPVAA